MKLTRKAFLEQAIALTGVAALPTGLSQAAEGAKAPDFVFGKLTETTPYETITPHFKAAFDFLRRKDLATLATGTYPLDGADGSAARAIIQEAELIPFQDRQVECHRRYIDIQSPITGPEMFGTYRLTDGEMALPFDEKGDCVLFDAKGNMRLTILRPGWFAIFFPPRGGHAPSCLVPGASRKIRKAVIKIRVTEERRSER